ncbi:hypothetical protein HMI56_000989 [Coelomomyces lativittatus]|nr:hypothetical protein HMI56_000989 [Coelomomyces lativittatus]
MGNIERSTLALPDQSIDDPLTWIQRQKQRAQFMETHLNEIDTFVTQPPSLKLEYNEHSLEGLKVGHAMDRFEEGKEFILTLKDQHVLEENDVDELENIDLRGTEKLEAEALAKKGYSPTDEEYLEHEAYDDTSVLLVGHPFSKKPQVLRKYDDPNERLKKSFTVSTPLSRPPVLKKTPTSMSLEKKSGEVSLVMESTLLAKGLYTIEKE